MDKMAKAKWGTWKRYNDLWEIGAEAGCYNVNGTHFDAPRDRRDYPYALICPTGYFLISNARELRTSDIHIGTWRDAQGRGRLTVPRGGIENLRGFTRKVKAKIAKVQHSGLPPKEVADQLGITPMTLHTWRKGSDTREPLRTLTTPRGERHTVLIPEQSLTAWLRKYRPDLLTVWQARV